MADRLEVLTRDLSAVLIAAWAPEEVEMQDDLLDTYGRGQLFDRRRTKADDMGFGIGDAFALASMFSPLLIAAAEWASKEIVGKALAEVSVAAIKKCIERKSPAPTPPLDGVLQLKLATDMLEHLSARGKALGVDEARMRTVCEQVSLTLVPALAAAIAAQPAIPTKVP